MENQNGQVISTVAIPIATWPCPIEPDNSNIRRKDFPDGFIFGSGTSAFQVEGAAAEGGKGPSVWDDFTLRTPDRILGGSNGNIACDMYHKYKGDIRAMKNMGFDAYRFSISWPRILPGGRRSAGINQEGIDYYNDLIDTVKANGMKPYATIFHWDLPDILQKEYDGFLSKKIVDDFREFAELCFWEFGDRVKWWTTVNEPWTYAVNGYVKGTFPPSKASCEPEQALKNLPGHRSVQRLDRCVPVTRLASDVKYDKSEPAKDAYTVARNLLLAHSAAVQSYRTKFKEAQKGQIGIVLNSHWHVPYDECSEDDRAAAKRAVDFMLGWFLEPVLYGHYPQSMIDFVPPENLAHFSYCESRTLKGSIDFVGLNYYTTNYTQYDPNPKGEGYLADQKIGFHNKNSKDVVIGEPTGATWLFIVPWGIYEHLVFMKKNYPHLPPVYITENGTSDDIYSDVKKEHKKTAAQICQDTSRVKYYQDHLAYIHKAINVDKVDVRGYFAWAWCDNFEWAEGYTSRFGINYVDYMNNLARYPKDSAIWLTKFLIKDEKIYKEIPLSKKRQIEDDSADGTDKRLRAMEE